MTCSIPSRAVASTPWATRASRCDALNPLESALPRPLLNYKQNVPVSPAFSTLVRPSNLYQSKDFKTLSFDTLSSCCHVTLLESALTKTQGGRGTPRLQSPISCNTLIINELIDSIPSRQSGSNGTHSLDRHSDLAPLSFTSSIFSTSSPHYFITSLFAPRCSP